MWVVTKNVKIRINNVEHQMQNVKLLLASISRLYVYYLYYLSNQKGILGLFNFWKVYVKISPESLMYSFKAQLWIIYKHYLHYLNIYKWAQERGVHKVVFSHLLLEFWDKPQVLYIFGILRPSELKLWCRISRFPCQNRIINGFVEWVPSSHASLSQICSCTVLLYRAESSVYIKHLTGVFHISTYSKFTKQYSQGREII